MGALAPGAACHVVLPVAVTLAHGGGFGGCHFLGGFTDIVGEPGSFELARTRRVAGWGGVGDDGVACNSMNRAHLFSPG